MNKQKIPSLLAVAIFTFFTVISWIVFDIVRMVQKKPAAEVPSEILSPITPSLDKSALENLRQRIYFDKELSFEVPAPAASPEPTPETATVSGEEAQ